jgi:predicted P-loop ATPase
MTDRDGVPRAQGPLAGNAPPELDDDLDDEGDDLLSLALAIAARGLPVFPCSANKRPAIPETSDGRGCLDATTDPGQVRALFAKAPNATLIGVACGPGSGIDVLDVDPRHGGDVWEHAHRSLLPETLIHGTPSGGYHRVFRHAPGARNSAGRIAPGIDVRGGGGYVIWPPSPGYTVIHDVDPAEWPAWLLERIIKAESTPRPSFPTDSASISDARLDGLLHSLLARLSQAAEGQKHDTLLRLSRTIGGYAHYFGLSDDQLVQMMLSTLPNTVSDWGNAEKTARDGLAYGRNAPLTLEDRPNPHASKRGNGQFAHNGQAEAPEPAADPDEEPPPNPAAKPTKATRQSRATLNVLALVTHINTTPAWRGVLHFNQLTENYEICGPFPPKDGQKDAPRPLREPHDLLLATMYFQANGFPKAGKNVVWDALAAVAHEHAYHPVRDHLASLHWDGTGRVSRLFQDYFNAEMPSDATELDRHVAYLEHISTSFMVGAVARVMQPGCKHDHVPVVIGRNQGMLKSSAIRALCHDPAWFTDNIPPDVSERDTKESLVGKWIIELAEIPHVRRDAERLKAFLSSQVDRYRAAYGRTSQDHPRQSAFIGTSNDLEFVDATGNRRFWPFVAAGLIDLAGIVADRDQLWAEAMALYRQDVKWWLPPAIEAIAAERQEAFAETDVWDTLIARWIAERGRRPFTMEELFAKETGITPYRDIVATPRADEMRAGRCLNRIGWHRSRCTLDGKRAYWWLK